MDVSTQKHVLRGMSLRAMSSHARRCSALPCSSTTVLSMITVSRQRRTSQGLKLGAKLNLASNCCSLLLVSDEKFNPHLLCDILLQHPQRAKTLHQYPRFSSELTYESSRHSVPTPCPPTSDERVEWRSEHVTAGPRSVNLHLYFMYCIRTSLSTADHICDGSSLRVQHLVIWQDYDDRTMMVG